MKNTKVAKIAPLSLLLGPFVAKNQEIYKDDPRMLAKFDDLKAEDLVIGEVSKNDGLHSASIKSPTRGFEGPAQKWRPVSVHSDKVVTLTSDEVFESKEAAQDMGDSGIFSYLTETGDTKLIIVISDAVGPNDVARTALNVLHQALRYDVVEDVSHTLPKAGQPGSIQIDNHFIVGEIEFVLGKPPADELEEGEPMELKAS